MAIRLKDRANGKGRGKRPFFSGVKKGGSEVGEGVDLGRRGEVGFWGWFIV